MSRYFADTGYWLALLDISDELHLKASQLAEKIETQPNAKLYTSDLVLAELLNSRPIYSNPYIRSIAAEVVIEIRASKQVEVVNLTGEAFGAALLKYKAYQDKDWSLTDCLSFVVMEQYGIQAALAYDRHFVQAGYQALLREPSE